MERRWSPKLIASVRVVMEVDASVDKKPRFQVRIERFPEASNLQFSGTALPSRFRSLPVASAPASGSEARIGGWTALPCFLGSVFLSERFLFWVLFVLQPSYGNQTSIHECFLWVKILIKFGVSIDR
ncbi:hypothetical protein ISN44_As11g025250 [Arabidopsis suecica]|uniref:Uncharacterized protein n=1 Tax=Arabidopsis suecica TaxID=45249 RepID=A0A8T1ZBQ7_ARASU|nr:hypothetical protein ISN44_As11g025250 [Arabidopsis suecica]